MKHLTIIALILLSSCTKDSYYSEECFTVLSVDRIDEDNGDYNIVVTTNTGSFDIRPNVQSNWTSKIGQEECKVVFND